MADGDGESGLLVLSDRFKEYCVCMHAIWPHAELRKLFDHRTFVSHPCPLVYSECNCTKRAFGPPVKRLSEESSECGYSTRTFIKSYLQCILCVDIRIKINKNFLANGASTCIHYLYEKSRGLEGRRSNGALSFHMELPSGIICSRASLAVARCGPCSKNNCQIRR